MIYIVHPNNKSTAKDIETVANKSAGEVRVKEVRRDCVFVQTDMSWGEAERLFAEVSDLVAVHQGDYINERKADEVPAKQ